MKFVHCSMLGDGKVGKTCLTTSYTKQVFSDEYIATIFENYAALYSVGPATSELKTIVAYSSVPLTVGGQEFVVSLFDTASQQVYERVRAYTYRESDVLVICFSVCDRRSFRSAHELWLPEARRYTKKKRPVILVGTQTDLRQGNVGEVSEDEGAKMAKKIGADCYLECSARNHEGTKAIFQHMVLSALKFRRRRNFITKFLFNR